MAKPKSVPKASDSVASHSAPSASRRGLGPSLNLRRYLPHDAPQRLQDYVYRGVDHSIIYQRLWKPLCTFAVRYVPRSVAPNCITLVALLITIATHIAMALYLPDLEEFGTAPAGLYVAGGVGLLLYQFFDNLDGVQARRTQTSSPLGLIMDHGCDAINTTIGAISFAAAIQCGCGWKAWSCLCSLIMVFLMATWEQFYRGEFVLPVINGANEGLMTSVVCYFITAAWGPSWWRRTVTIPSSMAEAVASVVSSLPFLQGPLVDCLHTPKGCEIQHNTLLVVGLALVSAGTVLGNLRQVFRSTRPGTVRHGFYRHSWLATRMPYVHALSRLLPLMAILVATTMWALLSPTGIYLAHGRVMCWTIGLLFATSDILLMVAHVCQVEFHAFRRTLVPYAFILLYAFVSAYSAGQVVLNEKALLLTLFLSASASFLHTSLNVVWETAQALDLPIFRIPNAQPPRTTKP